MKLGIDLRLVQTELDYEKAILAYHRNSSSLSKTDPP